MNRPVILSAAVVALLLPLGCKREQRVFDPGSAGSQLADGVALNEVHAGGSAPAGGSPAHGDGARDGQSSLCHEFDSAASASARAGACAG